MSYKLYSHRTSDSQGLEQWDSRSIDAELRSFENRTIIEVFDKYIPSNSKVLEGGCGLGAWCEWLEQKGHEVIGIEYYKEIVTKAKKLKPCVAVELGDVTSLRFPDSSFDAYLSLGVIEHFETGPQNALNEAMRILKPGGLAFITTPYLNVFRRLISHPIRDIYFLIRVLQGRKKYFWEYRYTKKELTTYIRDAGFEIIYVGVDDFNRDKTNSHMGLWGDWFFLRNKKGVQFELNKLGRIILRGLRIFPPSWHCSGIIVVAKAR